MPKSFDLAALTSSILLFLSMSQLYIFDCTKKVVGKQCFQSLLLAEVLHCGTVMSVEFSHRLFPKFIAQRQQIKFNVANAF